VIRGLFFFQQSLVWSAARFTPTPDNVSVRDEQTNVFQLPSGNKNNMRECPTGIKFIRKFTNGPYFTSINDHIAPTLIAAHRFVETSRYGRDD
jgi:hypothetical protein